MKNLILGLLLLTMTQTAFAQEQTSRRRASSRFSFGLSVLHWQEYLEGTAGGAKFNGRAQALAYGGEVGYEKFFGRRSQYFWALKAGAMTGTMRATVNGEKIQPQSMMGGYFEPGVFRRFSLKSEFGFVFPLTYRMVDFKSDTLVLQEADAQAYGIGVRGNLVFESGDYISTGVIYRMNQPSALWVISYDFR